MNKILIPLDGSKPSEKILNHTETLAKRTNAKIILIQVVPFFWPDEFLHVRELGNKLDHEASKYLYSIMRKMSHKGIEGEICVHEGNVPKVICDYAREKEVDLIAMCTHGRGGVKKWALGSVAEKIVQASPVPVLLYNCMNMKAETSYYRNILIPIDGSHFSENIFPQAHQLVKLFKSKVWFLNVIDLKLIEEFTTLGMINSQEKRIESIKHYLPNLEKRLQEAHVQYELIVKRGNPAMTICDFAENEEIDLIAMSTHGRSGISHWALGSVASKVVQASLKPVLLLRAKA
jgi:nucleotide-binding universal stress UspA family protein